MEKERRFLLGFSFAIFFSSSACLDGALELFGSFLFLRFGSHLEDGIGGGVGEKQRELGE